MSCEFDQCRNCSRFHITRRVRALDVFFEFTTKLSNGVFNRPRCSVGQTANGRTRDNANRIANLKEEVEIFESPFASSNALQHLQRPACSFPTGSALSARFMLEELATVMEKIDHGC